MTLYWADRKQPPAILGYAGSTATNRSMIFGGKQDSGALARNGERRDRVRGAEDIG